MRYVSTRGSAPVLSFDDVLLTGLARDGGLYVPETWPQLDPDQVRRFAKRPYDAVAVEVMWPYVEGAIDRGEFESMVFDAYSTFSHPDVCPVRPIGGGVWLLELFHGPTLSFKDVALQLVGQLFEHELRKRGEHLTIVGATSGDTGSAAIEACRDRETLDVFMLHPDGRVSEVQRRQMTSVLSPNIHNIAIEGTFDDCQDLVKAMFADLGFRDRHRLSAVNSINWGRILAQVVYYVRTAAVLGAPDTPVAFAVPTGNFGNVFAAWVARQMGVPIASLVIGSNENDILTRFLDTGVMEMHDVVATTSPAMDIQVSSNFERLLFELVGRDGEEVASRMERFREEGRIDLGDVLGPMREVFTGARIDDAAVQRIIAATYRRSDVVVDPHTAVGLGAAALRHRDPSVPIVCVATAHPAKFPDAVEQAIGDRPELPEHLADLFDREERCVTLPNDLQAVQGYIDSVIPS
ncbi:MAG TPA: threonine synthase [Acidimicrobiales bacterium]|nr:threonine synthase [Acidimicrobiales bacterium]